MYPYSISDTSTTWKKSRFVLSERSDFHLIENLSRAVHAFAIRMLTSISVDDMLLPRLVNWSTYCKSLLLKVETIPSCLKHMNLFLLRSRRGQCHLLFPLGNRDSARAVATMCHFCCVTNLGRSQNYYTSIWQWIHHRETDSNAKKLMSAIRF